MSNTEEFYGYDDEPEPPFTDGELKGKNVKVKGWAGVACRVVADDGETFATVVMIGDDHKERVAREYCIPIKREEYCGECGQMGCEHDGLDREDDCE